MNIFVANIERKVTDEQLQELFQQYGEIASLKLIRDRDTGVSKGYAFVEMANDDEAQKAIDALNEFDLEGRALAVNEARPKTEYKKSGKNYIPLNFNRELTGVDLMALYDQGNKRISEVLDTLEDLTSDERQTYLNEFAQQMARDNVNTQDKLEEALRKFICNL